MGGHRRKRAQRCALCRMLQGLCICEEIPSVLSRHRWLFVQHSSEAKKTTNTGHLAHRALEGSELSWFQSRVEPPRPELDWGAAEDLFLLFPRVGVEALDPAELASRARPSTIVVLDGTWGQTRKMARSIPELAAAPTVALPAEARPRFSLREETYSGGMSTLDAVSWLLQALEGPELAAPLMQLSRVFVERTMASRGTPLAGGPRLTSAGLVEP